MRFLLLVHSVLLVLASTGFTVVTAWSRGEAVQWCAYRYKFVNSWGEPFVFEYSLPVVGTFLTAFLVGACAFSIAWSRGARLVGPLGVVLSLAGLASFAIEGSHFFVDHGHSWLLYAPPVMLGLALLASFRGPRKTPRPTPPEIQFI